MTDHPGVPAALSRALTTRGYAELTPVQQAMLAPELEGADALVSARTGSGKTVAFGLALGPTLLGEDGAMPPPSSALALIVAPTRELALQVQRELSWLYQGANVASCVGGMDMREERRVLSRGTQIVVGTPGRLVDHISRGSLQMGSLRAVVLDEADEMLDLGFREELETILAAAPEERRTLMFSATVSGPIAKLAKQYQRDAVRVDTAADEPRQHADIDYRAMLAEPYEAEKAIINVLRYHEAENAIVFCGTRAAVARYAARLSNRGFRVVQLSGELSQQERSHALQAMRDGRADVCVATDVAARGIDLPGLELVIHADLPKNTEGLLHRSGRTGRAGRKGTSVLIVPPRAKKRVERLLQGAKVRASWGPAPSAADVAARDDERLLGDARWEAAVSEGERTLVARLTDAHSAEELAAMVVRQHRATRSAPEELKPVSDPHVSKPIGERPPQEKGPRGFDRSVWVTLSVGRSGRAEARWLLPLLLKRGGLDKAQIGAIRVREDETFVEIEGEAGDAFAERMAGRTLQDGMLVARADGPPPFEPRQKNHQKPEEKLGGKPGGGKAPYKGKPRADGAKGKAPWSPTGPGTTADGGAKLKRKPKKAR